MTDTRPPKPNLKFNVVATYPNTGDSRSFEVEAKASWKAYEALYALQAFKEWTYFLRGDTASAMVVIISKAV